MSSKPETKKEHIRKELRKLFKSMDFVSNKFLADEKAAGKYLGNNKMAKIKGMKKKLNTFEARLNTRPPRSDR